MNRTFLDWTRPALPAAADVLLEHYGSGAVCRMAGSLVVVPGARAGRRFKEVLEERARGAGLRLVPPRVMTIGHLPEALYLSRSKVAATEVAHMAWIAALRSAARLEQVFARRPHDHALGEWSALAGELMRLHREIAQGGIRFSDVVRVVPKAGADSWSDASRWQVLTDIQDRYERLLEGSGLKDRDLLRVAEVSAGRIEAGRDIWLLGIAEMPGVVRKMLDHVPDRVHPLVHAPPDLHERFDPYGCVVPAAWETADIPIADTCIEMADTPGDQADAVARALADGADSYAADEIVIGALSPEMVPWIAERLALAGVRVRDAAGIDARRTAPFRLLAAMADALVEDRWESMAALARHPDVEEWLERRGLDVGALLEATDDWFTEHLPDRLPETVWGERHGDVQALFTSLRELLAPLGGQGSAPLSSQLDRMLDLLLTVYDGRVWRADRPSHQEALQAMEQLAGAIRAFRQVPGSLDERCAPSAAIRLVLEAAGREAIPNPQQEAAVELLGWLELHLDDAPFAVIAGVNEPHLPESVAHDAFLPNALRARLGLADERLRYARDAYRLSAIVHARTSLRLVCGRTTASGDPIRPSRLLFAAPADQVARRVRRFYDASYSSDGVAAAATVSTGSNASGPGIVLPPRRVLEFEPPSVLSVTDFGPLLCDPYSWVLERHWRLSPVDDRAREMDGPTFGSLVHKVLERLGRDEAAHSGDETTVVRAMDRLLDQRVDELFGRGAQYARVAVRIQVEQARTRLRRVAEWHARRVAEGWRVAATEARIPAGGVDIGLGSPSMHVKGRVDRVEVHEITGEWALLDFKTSDKVDPPEKKHRKDGAWIDLQLPLYRWLLPHLLDEDGSLVFDGAADARIVLGYVPIAASGDVVVSEAGWNDDDFEAARAAAEGVVSLVRSGRVEFDRERVASYTGTAMKALLGMGVLEGDVE